MVGYLKESSCKLCFSNKYITYLVSSIQYFSNHHNEYVIFFIFLLLLFEWYDGLHHFLIISGHTGPTDLDNIFQAKNRTPRLDE